MHSFCHSATTEISSLPLTTPLYFLCYTSTTASSKCFGCVCVGPYEHVCIDKCNWQIESHSWRPSSCLKCVEMNQCMMPSQQLINTDWNSEPVGILGILIFFVTLCLWPCHIHLLVCLWIMDPHSRAPKKNTSHENEVLPKDTTHLIQRPCSVSYTHLTLPTRRTV